MADDSSDDSSEGQSTDECMYSCLEYMFPCLDNMFSCLYYIFSCPERLLSGKGPLYVKIIGKYQT